MKINLAQLNAEVRITGATAVEIEADSDTYAGFGSAVVEVEWSVSGEQWFSFSSAITLNSSTRAAREIDNDVLTRLRVTTADGTADPAAEVHTIPALSGA